jgi:hypothetical protein
MLVGISSGASLARSQKLSEIPENAKVLTFATILEHYLSVEGLLNNNTFQKY